MGASHVYRLLFEPLKVIIGVYVMSCHSEMSHKTIDACGLHCPQPILRCMAALADMRQGEILHLITTDPDARREIGVFIAHTDHELLASVRENQWDHFYIEKKCAVTAGRMLNRGTEFKFFFDSPLPC